MANHSSIIAMRIPRAIKGGKKMTNLDNVVRSRDITLLTKVCIVRAEGEGGDRSLNS